MKKKNPIQAMILSSILEAIRMVSKYLDNSSYCFCRLTEFLPTDKKIYYADNSLN